MGLWVTIAIWLLFVAATLRPPFRRGRPGFVIFMMTMTFNEIPVVLLAVFLLAIAATAFDPAFSDGAGRPAAAAAALVVAGLVWLQLRARSARPAMEAALRTALGSQWVNMSGPGVDGRTEPHWLAGMLLPFQRRAKGVRRLRNVRYGPDPHAHRLDLYQGEGPSSGRPVLVHLHGGGFSQGGKSREGVVLLNQLAANGWLCVSADYRLRGAGAFPFPLQDAKRVIAWVRENAAAHNADPDQVFLIGASAGGHLAVSAALTPNQPRFQPGFESVDTTVRAAIALYGYLGARSVDPASSPEALASPDAPPLFIIHGGHDTMVPAVDTRSVAATVRAASRSVVAYAELPHTQHAFDLFASVRARDTADVVETFLDWVRAGDTSKRQPPPR